jgi:hypothetical protein
MAEGAMLVGSPWFRFVVAALATWRLTHLLALEDGPFDLLARLRAALGRAGRLLDCFQCLSLWIAAPLALFVTTRASAWWCVWLALSAVACLIQRATEPSVVVQPMTEGDPDVLLRTEAGRDRGQAHE